MNKLYKKHSSKFLYNIRMAQSGIDNELFKKLNDEIWESRTFYQGFQYRLPAFRDKTDSKNTLVISTHRYIKKQSEVSENEIHKAKQIRKKYFEEKQKL